MDVVGVGPHPEPWPDDPRLDPELLAAGDRRNVVDRYRYWRRDAIVADLDTRRHGFHVAIENWEHDFNIGSVVRTANAFLAAEVHIVGKRRWNRRGAMVTDRYQHVRHHDDVDALVRWASDDGAAAGRQSTTCPGRCRWRPTSCRERACWCSARRGRGCRTPHVRRPWRRCRSRSTGRPARSTPVRPPPSRCTRGSASTRSPRPPDVEWCAARIQRSILAGRNAADEALGVERGRDPEPATEPAGRAARHPAARERRRPRCAGRRHAAPRRWRRPTPTTRWRGRCSPRSALADGDPVAAYAYARTGYHRSLDQLRRNGWKGHGPVPWEHEPNRGFLRSLHALGQAAAVIGEDRRGGPLRTVPASTPAPPPLRRSPA